MQSNENGRVCVVCGSPLVFSPPGWACVDHPRADQDADESEQEPGYNYPLVYLDGDVVTHADGHELYPDDELERVQVDFPGAVNGTQTDADEKAPLGWINNAAITLDRGEDAVTLTISVGDPRVAFAFTVRRLPDGRLVMSLPYPGETWLHMPLRKLQEGTYEIGE